MKNLNDWLIVLIVFGIALVSRALFLGSINSVVFDEVHFGKFISSYCCTHERFFDIHPPIGKLIIAGGAYVGGYNGDFSFESIGQDYGATPIGDIRMVLASIGALLPVILFILLRQTGVSRALSFLGAVAVALDNALIIESRLIITDSILLVATFGAVACAIASVRASTQWQSWMWAICAGIASGVAVGTKFTGLVGGAIVGVIFLVQMWKDRREVGTWILRAVSAGAVCIVVYLLGWTLHFSLLTMPGSGDAWGVPTGAFWQDLVTTHKQMVSANYHLTADHPYGSKWWTWPIMERSVFYWQGQSNQFIYLLGNPVVWWGSSALFLVGICALFFSLASGKYQRIREIVSSGAWIFLLGYFMSFIPLTRVPRVLFLYHYLTPLLFSLLFAIWWLDRTLFPKKYTMIFATMCIIVGFIFISPVTYGVTLPDVWYQVLFFIPTWR